jgi:hypothetical protein
VRHAALVALALVFVHLPESASSQTATLVPTVGGGYVLHVPGEGSVTVARLVGGGTMIHRPQSGTQLVPPPLPAGGPIGGIPPLPLAILPTVVTLTEAAVPAVPALPEGAVPADSTLPGVAAASRPAVGPLTTFVTPLPGGGMTVQTVGRGTSEIVRIPGGYTLQRTADGVTVVVPPGSCEQRRRCR